MATMKVLTTKLIRGNTFPFDNFFLKCRGLKVSKIISSVVFLICFWGVVLGYAEIRWYTIYNDEEYMISIDTQHFYSTLDTGEIYKANFWTRRVLKNNPAIVMLFHEEMCQNPKTNEIQTRLLRMITYTNGKLTRDNRIFEEWEDVIPNSIGEIVFWNIVEYDLKKHEEKDK
ncbi:MAG: hypothetical protein RIN56_15165 [Sporomusaceae bacterium]|nr:hypothetical protein [Sporomusaceae bacterium]